MASPTQCPYCGQFIRPGSSQCGYCGQFLGPQFEGPSQGYPSPGAGYPPQYGYAPGPGPYAGYPPAQGGAPPGYGSPGPSPPASKKSRWVVGVVLAVVVVVVLLVVLLAVPFSKGSATQNISCYTAGSSGSPLYYNQTLSSGTVTVSWTSSGAKAVVLIGEGYGSSAVLVYQSASASNPSGWTTSGSGTFSSPGNNFVAACVADTTVSTTVSITFSTSGPLL